MNSRKRNLAPSSRRGPGLAAAVTGAPAGPAAASAAAAGAPVGLASSPPASLQANGFHARWTSSSLVSFRHESSPSAGQSTSRTRVSPSAPSFKGTPPCESNAQDKETINVDADETIEDGRTEKRLNWTKDEDIRLASAWVHNSKDPVDGTDRKSDQYRADVCRRRNRNQLKIRWNRVKKPVSEFHGCWVKTNKVYRSGVSDDQLMEIAEKMYASDHSDKEFMLKHIWKVEKEKNKSTTNSPAAVVNLEDNPNICPIGHKRAKNKRYGKKKTLEAYSAISEKLDKFIEVSTLARKDREKMSETQQHLANSKVEAARLNEKAAEKQLKCKMLDTCRELLEKAPESMRLALFASYN
ncbi:hypothetical protein GQ55_6G244300 [Panicum hallii var. hallii]|uniref:Myb-like domain-containing protein n=1 Tax=Panicum hallii var. hallii TaxID=1504633 RepID=A0A2T7D972_9POAL|nr:hypothetical protein GQ55_6G244300 [Panicum hallii var. hallii]